MNQRILFSQFPIKRLWVAVMVPPTIKTDVELNMITDELLLGESQNDQLIEYFGRYEFKRWLNEVMNGADSITQTTEQPMKMNQYQATSPAQNSVGNSAVENTPKIQIDRTKYETLLTQADLTRWIEQGFIVCPIDLNFRRIFHRTISH